MASSRSALAANQLPHHQSPWIAPVATYVSMSIVRCRLRNHAGPAVLGEYVEGTLLLADISGFTALSERFAKHGKEGDETLTFLLNDYFEAMVGIAANHGGDVLQFGGDALLAVFGATPLGASGRDQQSPTESGTGASVLAATHCGLHMQKAMEQFQRLRLSMSIGVHWGKFLLASAGSAEGRLQQVVVGQTLNRLASVEALAEPGELLITPEAKRMLNDRVQLGSPREDCFPVVAPENHADFQPPRGDALQGALEELEELEPPVALELLRPYLIPAVYRRIIDDPAGYGNDGEHRFIATMFVNFDDMSEVMSDFGEHRLADTVRLLDAYLAEMMGTIMRHGGALARVSAEPRGDKLLVLFGAPVGVENPEQRAVRCALEMNGRLEQLNAQAPVALRQRIGITCGSAFCGNVGSDRRREYTVIGDEVNMAARLMGKAEATEIFVSRDVWQKARDSFRFKSRGPIQLKGKQQAVDVYQLLSRRPRSGHATGKRRTLVGRSDECEQFREIARGVIEGNGQLLTICGEAGIGKSLLTNEFASHCRDNGMRSLRGYCQSFGTSIPYLPWAEILRDIADIRRRDSTATCRQKLEAMLSRADPEFAEWSPLLGTVIGTPISDNQRTASLAPRQRKEKIFALCLGLLRLWAREGAGLIVIEDIHWIDPLSRDLLVYVASQLLEAPVLILSTHRPGFESPSWSDDTQVAKMALGPLSDTSAVEMLQLLLKTKSVPDDLARLVLDKTQGNPFYVEEIVLALRASENLVWDPATERFEWIKGSKEVNLPGTIQGVILSRLDRLPEEQRRMLQIASVFGRNFSPDTLRSVLPFELTSESLDSKLQEVAKLELIDSGRPSPNPSYAFRHALVQEVAYESLSYARRREIHRAIGEELEQAHKETVDEQCDVLARHFDLARASEKAAQYLVMAGDNAKRVYANTEAADYYERALVHLRVPEINAELDVIARVLEDLGDVRSLAGDYAVAVGRYLEALECVERPIPRARLEGKLGGVCYRQGQPHQGIEHLEMGLGHLGIYVPRTRWQVRASILRQILIQAAHTMFPFVYVRQRSKDAEAAKAAKAAIEIYEAVSRITYEFNLEKTLDAHLRQLNLCETIPGSPEMAQTYSSHGVVCGLVPNFSRAIRYQKRGLAIREAEQDRWGVAQSLNFMGFNYYCMGRREESISSMEQSARIFAEVGDRWETEVSYLFLSLNYMRKGELELALQHARTSLDHSRRAEDSQGMGWALEALAEATSRVGKLPEALKYCQQALECSEQARDRMWAAVVRRGLGQIHLRMGNRQQAVDEMEQSVQQIRDYGLRHEFVMGAYPGLAEARLSFLDDEREPAAKRASLKRIKKLCRKSVRIAKNFPNWLGYAYRVSALRERAAGRQAAARRFFEQSLEASASLGAYFELAVTYVEKGKFLLELGDPEAYHCLNEAVRLFQECGAEMDRESAESLGVPVHGRVDDRDSEPSAPNPRSNCRTQKGKTV